MFKNIFRGQSSENLLIEEYRKYRQGAKELSEIILQKYTDDRSLTVITQLMGVRHGKSIIMESEDEMNFLMDFSLYEYRVEGKNFVERYQAENPGLTQATSQIIAAKLLAYTSLFKITATQPSNSIITLSNLLDDLQEVELLDINLSRTATPGHLVFTRLLPFGNINMTSGMFCIFPSSYEKALLKEYKSKMKKVKSDIESQQRFIAFYKLNRTKGIEARTNSF
jgi:hypothetical protein